MGKKIGGEWFTTTKTDRVVASPLLGQCGSLIQALVAMVGFIAVMSKSLRANSLSAVELSNGIL